MIKLLDTRNDEVAEFRGLNEAVLFCLQRSTDKTSFDYNSSKEYQIVANHLLSDAERIHDITVAKKIEIINKSDYQITEQHKCKGKGICHICNDEGIYYYNIKYQEFYLKTCSSCLGIESRKDIYRHSKESVMGNYLEIERMVKGIKDLDDLIDCTNKNKEIELKINDKLYTEHNKQDTINLITIKYKLMSITVDSDSFKLSKLIDVFGKYGSIIYRNAPFDKFHYQSYEGAYI